MALSSHDTTIHAKDLLSSGQRARDTFLTTMLWVVYAYLWLPLISLIAWLVGIDFAYEVVARAGGIQNLVGLLLWFGVALGLILTLVTGWSGTQYFRFYRRERRIAVTPLEAETERELWGLDHEGFMRLRTGRSLTVSLDADARISEVRKKPGYMERPRGPVGDYS